MDRERLARKTGCGLGLPAISFCVCKRWAAKGSQWSRGDTSGNIPNVTISQLLALLPAIQITCRAMQKASARRVSPVTLGPPR